MFNLVDHRELKGSTERNKYFNNLEEVKKWLTSDIFDYSDCQSMEDINDKLREEAQGNAYYELTEEV